VVYRFSQDGKSPCRRRALSQVVISVGRNEHDRDLESPRRQLLLHLKTVHSWHRKVENHAADGVQSAGPQKLLPRCERLDLERERPQKPLERVAETLIIVDDGDDTSATLVDRIARTLFAPQRVHRYIERGSGWSNVCSFEDRPGRGQPRGRPAGLRLFNCARVCARILCIIGAR
jgi:hypothetical protein